MCTKEQFIEIAEHYQIEIVAKKKLTVKTRLKQGLGEMGVFWGQSASSQGASFQSSPSLTFEQQRELLQMRD